MDYDRHRVEFPTPAPLKLLRVFDLSHNTVLKLNSFYLYINSAEQARLEILISNGANLATTVHGANT